jgi:hypothetical protein
LGDDTDVAIQCLDVVNDTHENLRAVGPHGSKRGIQLI